MFFKNRIVGVAVILVLLFVTGCSSPEPPLPDFSGWEVAGEHPIDIDEDGQTDLQITVYCDSTPLQCNNAIWTYTLPGNNRELPFELLIWGNFTRDENRLQKDGAYLIIKDITRCYVKDARYAQLFAKDSEYSEYRFIQKKICFRPEGIEGEAEIRVTDPESPFGKLLVAMWMQAGLSEDKAAIQMFYWTYRPEDPVE